MTQQRKQLIAGMACALLALAGVFAYTATISSEAQVKRQAALERYGGEQTQVVVAAEAIACGTELDSSNTELVTWLVDLLPETDTASSPDQVRGLLAQTDIAKGEPITLNRVGTGSSRITVPEGLRAVTVSSDDVLAVGGSVRQGSFVDVYVESSKGRVVLLGKNILVLETSAVLEQNDGKAITWVTLAVTPDSVSDLLTASTNGTIHLVLPGGQTTTKGD